MRIATLCLAFTASFITSAFALDPSWPEIRDSLYGDRLTTPARNIIKIHTPYRTGDDARTQISAAINAPKGRNISAITVVLDENPMPVSAVFNFKEPVPQFFFDITMRVNGPTPIHIIAKAENGQLFVAEGFIKTSGTGACAAPPGSSREEALASLGNMNIGITKKAQTSNLLAQLGAFSSTNKQVDIGISHPSHSGMQMDQISLLFIPLRYVENVKVDLNGIGYVDVTGSISLSENPEISISVPGKTRQVGVTMTDTDGTVSHAEKSLAEY